MQKKKYEEDEEILLSPLFFQGLKFFDLYKLIKTFIILNRLFLYFYAYNIFMSLSHLKNIYINNHYS